MSMSAAFKTHCRLFLVIRQQMSGGGCLAGNGLCLRHQTKKDYSIKFDEIGFRFCVSYDAAYLQIIGKLQELRMHYGHNRDS